MRYIILVFLSLFTLTSIANPEVAGLEAEYKKLSKTYILNSDRSREYRYSMELTLYTHTAMNRTYGETFIVYNPDFQKLVIHSSYTKQKDGTIIQTPENAFVEVLPRQAANAPTYSFLKEMVIVHTGLELGATIYLDYSIIFEHQYFRASELDVCDVIAQSSPVKDYTITIRAPENRPLFYELSNYDAEPVVSSVDTLGEVAMKEIVWKITDMPAAPRTPQATVMGGDIPMLTISSYDSNDDALKSCYHRLMSSSEERRYMTSFGFSGGRTVYENQRGDSLLAALTEKLIMGKKTDTEKLYSILDYIIEDLDLSRLSFVETNHGARTFDKIINSVYGTETEKVNLLAALLNAAGIDASVVAAYLNNANINSCGISAIDEFLVVAEADGKQFLLTPKHKKMSDAVWYADYAWFFSIISPVVSDKVDSITYSGKLLELELPSTNLDYSYTINMEPEKAEMQIVASVGDAFIPYTSDYVSAYTAGDKDGKEERGEGFSKFTYSTSEQLKENNKYILFTLPDSPHSLSHAPYKSYNSRRDENLLLPYKAKESYKYTIHLPKNMKLRTPVSVKTIDNNAGTVSMSIKNKRGNIVEVTRTLEIKKQFISPAEYDDFRSIVNEWAGNSQLLFFCR